MSRARRLTVTSVVAALLVSAGVYVPVTLTADPPAAVAQVDAPSPVVNVPTPETWPGDGVSAVGAIGFDGVLATNDAAPVPRPMASITKTVTALVVLRAKPLAPGEDGPQVTFTAEDEALRGEILKQDGIVEPAVPGTSLSQRDLLEGALLASANNYASALGVWAYGSNDAFVAAATPPSVRRRARLTRGPAGRTARRRSPRPRSASRRRAAWGSPRSSPRAGAHGG